MRRRDLYQIKTSDVWQQQAKKAADVVNSGEKKPSDLSKIWTDLKKELASLSHTKCWYCESRQARSDNAVDHFRPKSKYPWLAFCVENFRFSCSFCNSRHTNPETGEVEGKGDFFPLLKGSKQAMRETELAFEQPVLLDPCVAVDCGLLDFLANGSPCSAQPDNPIAVERVSESIKLYHLDHPDLNEQRRVLALKLRDWIKTADLLYPRIVSGEDPISQTAFGGVVESVAGCIDDTAELSAFARRMVKTHRSKPWIELVLDGV